MNPIANIRERLGVTQAAMAEALQVSQGNVSNYEQRGQTMPPDVATRLIAYAEKLGVLISYDDVYGPISRRRAARLAKPPRQPPSVKNLK